MTYLTLSNNKTRVEVNIKSKILLLEIKYGLNFDNPNIAYNIGMKNRITPKNKLMTPTCLNVNRWYIGGGQHTILYILHINISPKETSHHGYSSDL